MPMSTIVAISPEVQAPMLAARRRARYGYVLALHLVLLCAAGRPPTDIAAVLVCSRSSVYRTVRAYRAGTLGLELDEAGRLSPPVRPSVLGPTRRRSLLALLKAPPRAYGWCRTRWSCATLAATFQAKRGLTVSAETMRRWVHEVGWVWQTTPKFPLRWGIIKRILFGMYEFDEQPSRGVAESDLLTMGGHVLISQDLRRFDTVGFSSHRCNQNSDAVWGVEAGQARRQR